MSREIIINHASQETRVAVLEQGSVMELYHERKKEKGIVGNIYKGRVLKVLPGMESAFVDIGMEKASFLFIDDVLQDFSVYDEYDDESDDRPVPHQQPSGRREKRPPIEPGGAENPVPML